MTFNVSHQTSPDWQALRKGLHSFVRSRVPENDIDDVVSDILEAIVRNKASLQTADNPSAWIYAVARSKITDFYRKQGRHRMAQYDLKTDPTLPGSPKNQSVDARPDMTGLSDCLLGFISSMPDADRTVLTEIDLQQTRQTDFATRYDIALPTVKSRVRRARKRLRDRLVSCCPTGMPDGCNNTCRGTTPCGVN
ncbi:sigma-70 family RNA polymerase sigma factor [Thalassospira australica]|uniref:sigma-70 family RNA polymerase sigma factor n=1 Tax=Thalassospira australica TaxID=1528106 RepID=UPI003850A6A0